MDHPSRKNICFSAGMALFLGLAATATANEDEKSKKAAVVETQTQSRVPDKDVPANHHD
jgi:hypothetical protein